MAEKRTKKNFAIGQLGGGKKELFGIVDIVIMQSMFEKNKSVKQIINQYGLIIVDECHHISATNFSRIISSSAAKYIYGLTATPICKDGHHPIIFIHCGPIRHKVNAKHEAFVFINEKKEGIDIIQIPNNHLRFMVVDNVIVWYGDINILGRSYNDSSLIRIKDEVLAN